MNENEQTSPLRPKLWLVIGDAFLALTVRACLVKMGPFRSATVSTVKRAICMGEPNGIVVSKQA